MRIVTSDTPLQDAAAELTAQLRTLCGQPTLLLLSGGSALSLLPFVPTEVLGPHLTIGMLDERFSNDETVCNFFQLTETTFYIKAKSHGATFIATSPTLGETRIQLCDRFAKALQTWRSAHPAGSVVATMGIGIDGHTAGIMPGQYPVDFFGSAWVVDYVVPVSVNQHTERITVTYTFLCDLVTEAIVLAAGPQKQLIVEQLHPPSNDDLMVPAQILHSMKSVTVFSGGAA